MSKDHPSPGRPPIPPPTPTVLLQASPYHPALSLYVSQKNAQASAEALGENWTPIVFACGYLITNGWKFQDANGVVETFCPVPHECLETIQEIVNEVQKANLAPKYHAIHVKQALRDHPTLAALSPALFESVVQCTLLRVKHPPYNGSKDDWLTVPPWALRMPKRRMRIVR